MSRENVPPKSSREGFAKQAMAQGMPEPPELYFVTQDRLATLFVAHGEARVYDPHEVILEPGDKVEMMYMRFMLMQKTPQPRTVAMSYVACARRIMIADLQERESLRGAPGGEGERRRAPLTQWPRR